MSEMSWQKRKAQVLPTTKPEALPIVAYLYEYETGNKHVSFKRSIGTVAATSPLTDHAQATAQLSALQDEVDRLKADAERYRWLRDEGRWNDFSVEQQRPGWITTHSTESLDAAIDQARLAQKGGA
jgi:hypothetical protein